MKSFSDITKDINLKKIGSNTSLLRFFVCVVIASLFWGLNALSKVYVTTIEYPIQFINIPDQLALKSDLPDKLTIKVEGYGFSLLESEVFGGYRPYVINVGREIQDQQDNGSLAINIAERVPYIESKVLKHTQIVSIFPETLDIIFDKIISKEVPIVGDLDITLADQYMLADDFSFSPTHVTISGPESSVDSIESITTVSQKYEDLSKEVVRNISLKSIESITVVPKRAVLNIPVELSVLSSIKVPIQIYPENDSVKVVTFPSFVDVNYRIGVSKAGEISLDNFKAIAKCDSGSSALSVELVVDGKWLVDYQYSPKMVDYIIEKR